MIVPKPGVRIAPGSPFPKTMSRVDIGKKSWAMESRRESKMEPLFGSPEGRHTDRTPIECSECGWRGKVMDCYHGYAPIAPDDVEPCDMCPECGGEDLIIE